MQGPSAGGDAGVEGGEAGEEDGGADRAEAWDGAPGAKGAALCLTLSKNCLLCLPLAV